MDIRDEYVCRIADGQRNRTLKGRGATTSSTGILVSCQCVPPDLAVSIDGAATEELDVIARQEEESASVLVGEVV